MAESTFSILITTKNRKDDLAYTLAKIKPILALENVECIICDDGSTDATATFVQTEYLEIQFIQNTTSKGLIYSRNRLLAIVKTDYAISIDDDAHFISEKPLESIGTYFQKHKHCGLIALRIFWGLQEPDSTYSGEKPKRVQGFVGCAHVWKMTAWREIPNYPAWFVFYGEENFASYQLFKKGWEIHYLPEVLVNHRVDLKARKNNHDYITRQRRALRAGWYLFFLFYPLQLIPRKLVYSLWIQFKIKVFRGDFKAFVAICLAIIDLVFNMPRILKNSNRLSMKEYEEYEKLAGTNIYWSPE